MKLLILVLLAVGTFAEENYDGPEYATKDHSMFMLPEESLGLWSRADEPSYKPPNDRHRRIVGGREAVPNSIPWQVYLSGFIIVANRNLTNHCGGSVISANAVLTTAQCVHGVLRTEVLAGAHNRVRVEPGQQRRTVLPANFRIHPETGRYQTRLAILIITQPFTLNNFVQAVRLPTGFERETFAGERASLSGWGRIGTNQPFSEVLRVVEVPVITNSECLKVFDPLDIDDNTLCTSVAQGTGACAGETGGPLTVKRPGDSRPILIGVFTHSAQCADRQIAPQRHSRITNFLKWIKANH